MSIKVAASTVVERDGSFLLVREGKDPKGRFSLPGGGPKKRETLKDAAIRETLEETGLEVRLRGLVGVYQTPRTEARNNLIRFAFEAREVGGLIRVSEDHPEVDFFPYKMIKKMHEAGELSSLSVLTALRDFRKSKGVNSGIITDLPRVKRKLLLPKHLAELEPEEV